MNERLSALTCPACGAGGLSRGARLTFDTRAGVLSSSIHSCRECSHRFLLTDEESHTLSEAAYTHDYTGFREDPVFAAKVAEALESDIKPLLPPPARVLDVGCGNGAFLQAAIAAGYEAEGIDISEAAVSHCRGLGLSAQVVDFPNHDFPRKFDVIAMWDVVEHLRAPGEFIAHARSQLAPGGILLLKIPGFNGPTLWAVGAFKHLSKSILGAPNHVQYFNERSCQRLLERVGFQEIVWLRSRRFRSKPPTRSLTRLLSRTVSGALSRISGDHNLFVAARRAGAGE